MCSFVLLEWPLHSSAFPCFPNCIWVDFRLLTHLPLIYTSVNRVSIGSNNGLWPIRLHAIILTNAVLLSLRLLRRKFSDIFIKLQNFMKMHLKTSSAKWRPFRPRGDELIKLVEYFFYHLCFGLVYQAEIRVGSFELVCCSYIACLLDFLCVVFGLIVCFFYFLDVYSAVFLLWFYYSESYS